MAKQLWFYTGSQDLYGPETLQQVDEQSKVVVQQLVGRGTLRSRLHSPTRHFVNSVQTRSSRQSQRKSDFRRS